MGNLYELRHGSAALIAENEMHQPTSMTPGFDRRRRLRVSLRLDVQLFRDRVGEAITTKTENVSSEGFYCNADGEFQAGERAECLILLPAMHPHDSKEALGLRCRVRIVRVDRPPSGPAGIGCRIEEYSVSRVAARTIS